MSWPPTTGEFLPRADEAVGVRRKLAGYSLNFSHRRGEHKARRFERVLGIAEQDIDYLEGAIYTGILAVPVRAVGKRSPYGVACDVRVPVRGRGDGSNRVAKVTTAWMLDGPDAVPRLVSAYIKG